MTPPSHPLCYFLEIVREFYAFYVFRHNEQKYKIPIVVQPCLESVLVRGVEIPCIASEIIEIYFACDLDFTVQCKRLTFSGRQSYPWLARMIVKSLPPWANGVGQIKRRDLSVQAKHWLGFVGNHLLPSTNDQDVTETSGPMLPFDDLFGEGHEDIDDEVEVDLIEGLPEA
ncbi:hypothetical protein BC332_13738 [Capsicum chinense]|nr:hypothetical protein BC332_13738 [Capsicum chinense]